MCLQTSPPQNKYGNFIRPGKKKEFLARKSACRIDARVSFNSLDKRITIFGEIETGHRTLHLNEPGMNNL